MKVRLVIDSSVNTFSMEGLDVVSVPLKIRTSEKEYVDDINCDVHQMIVDLGNYKGKSTSSCPNTAEWLDAMGDADEVYLFPISRNLSGSYNAAMMAKDMYIEENPEKKVYIVDTLTIAGEIRLVMEKIRPLIQAGTPFEDVVAAIEEYQKHLETTFILQDLTNLANNGRVNKVIAEACGFFGIALIGIASTEGTIEMVSKKRGEKKAIREMVDVMVNHGYKGGQVRIDHCENEKGALAMRDAILAIEPNANIEIGVCHALTAFYASKGGIVLGFEAH